MILQYIIPVIVAAAGGGWLYAKTKTIGDSLDFDGELNLDLETGLTAILGYLTKGGDASVTLIVLNYGKSTYKADSIKLNIIDENGNILGYQTQPVADIQIAPQTNTSIEIPMFLKPAFFTYIVRNANGETTLKKFTNAIKNYYKTGKFGVILKFKGNVMKAGVSLPFNIDYNI